MQSSLRQVFIVAGGILLALAILLGLCALYVIVTHLWGAEVVVVDHARMIRH